MKNNIAATCALCFTSAMLGAGFVSLLGSGRQPQPTREENIARRKAAEASLAQLESVYQTGMQINAEEAGFRAPIRPPVATSAPGGGFVLVITATGASYVVSQDGIARQITLIDGQYRTTPDLWTGSTISKSDLSVLPKEKP